MPLLISFMIKDEKTLFEMPTVNKSLLIGVKTHMLFNVNLLCRLRLLILDLLG